MLGILYGQFEENLEWLALRLPPEILLESQDLSDYVFDVLQTEYFNVIYRDLSKRRKRKLLDRVRPLNEIHIDSNIISNYTKPRDLKL